MDARETARAIERILDGCYVTETARCALVDCIEQAITSSAREVERLRERVDSAVSYFMSNGDRVGVACYDDGAPSGKWIAISAAIGDALKDERGKVILHPTADAAFAALAAMKGTTNE